jgi:hypothetical protein
MTTLVNLGAVLVFALVVFAVVAVALRFLIPSEPYPSARAERSRADSWRRGLADVVGLLAVLALLNLAVEVRFAYGAPFGERGDATVEVVEVGACERGPLGFGVARTCGLASFRSSAADPPPGVIEVVTGAPVAPGDLVAEYSSSGWTDFALIGSGGSRWQPVSAEERPNLVWLPTATLVAATALVAALRRRIAARLASGAVRGTRSGA